MQHFDHFHGHADSGSIVDRSRAKIPGIKVSGDDHDLLRMLASLEVADDVVAGRVWKLLRSECQMHAHIALFRKPCDEVGIFSSDRSGGNARRRAVSSVRKTVIGVAHRTHQSGDCPKISSSFRSRATIANRFSIGYERESGGGLLLVEELVEQDDLARDFIATECPEFVESIHHDHFGAEAVNGCRCASAKGGENDFLNGTADLPNVFGEFGGLSAPDPVRNPGFL